MALCYWRNNSWHEHITINQKGSLKMNACRPLHKKVEKTSNLIQPVKQPHSDIQPLPTQKNAIPRGAR